MAEFKYRVQENISNDKRNITITNKKKEKDKKGIERKHYQYHCNLCGFDSGEHYSPKKEQYKNEQYIVETHGIQHYEQSNKGRSLEEEQKNDRFKKELALKNGIKEENYIVIDCRYSDLEFIKRNILYSSLSNFYDLNKINWDKVEGFALSSRVKEACDSWNGGIHNTTQIGVIMKLNRSTISNYLKKGNELKWCEYNSIEERIKGIEKGFINAKKSNEKSVEIFKDGISLGVFLSIMELSTKSIELFGINLDNSNISAVCSGRIKGYKGFTFKYFLI